MFPMALFALISAGVVMALFDGPSDEPESEAEDTAGGPGDESSPIGANMILGTSGDDSMEGSPDDDVIDAGDGDDFVDGGAGDDTIFGGAGDDLIIAERGANQLFGGDGADVLIAEDFPGAPYAPDQLFGGDGDDFLWGDDGDTMTGGAGRDIFSAWFDEADDAPVTITDFDWLDEQLFLDFDAGVFGSLGDDDLTHEVDNTAFLVRLFVAGKEAAILTNTTTFDPTRVTVTSYA